MHTLLDHDGGSAGGTGYVPPPAPIRRPEADCTADSAGGLTFDVAVPAGEEGWGAALLLRHRGGYGTDGPVRLPLSPSGLGRLRATLPSTVPLAEGRWDAFLVPADGEGLRLLSGARVLGPLVHRAPGAHRGWLGVRVPYATRRGNLTVRSWLRRSHAEVRRVLRTEAGLVLTGRLYGAQVGRGARLETRPLRGPGETLRAPVRPAPDDVAAFACELPCRTLRGPGVWQLWLRPCADAEPVRLGRLLDGVADRRRLPACPPLMTGGFGVSVCYDPANDLVLRVERTTAAFSK
jgi:hypothetical protein